MLRSVGSQGQVLHRQALTVATTGGCDYMQRCHDNMRSELLNIIILKTIDIKKVNVETFT